MTARDLFKRTPLRLAATFATLFAVSVIALFAVLYFSISTVLEGQIRGRVQETVDSLSSIDEQRGFDDLLAVVRSESRSVRDADIIFSLIDDNGEVLAGNVHGIPPGDGWLSLTRPDIDEMSGRGDPGDEFYAIWRPVSKGKLLVGTSNRELRRTQFLLLEMLAWGLLATMVVVGVCGAFLARRMQHRINAFAATLAAVSNGQIGARVPMLGSEDDIDHVGAQINRTLSHLQRLIENVNQSSSDIAHDLKKPVGRLRQRLDLARRNSRDVAEFRSVLEDTMSELDSMIETFDALLRITQIEAGARKARFEVLDLMSVLADVADVYGAVAEDSSDMLEASLALNRQAPIRGDRELLVQLFANLVENAIRHCPPSTRIGITLKETARTFDAVVTDTGPGIPASERENVFRRLYRLERARSTPGSGLGLSLVAAIAELHDASVLLESNSPGLRVVVSFPKGPA